MKKEHLNIIKSNHITISQNSLFYCPELLIISSIKKSQRISRSSLLLFQIFIEEFSSPIYKCVGEDLEMY